MKLEEKIYIGDIYKVTKSVVTKVPKTVYENIGIECLVCSNETIKISESITTINETYELYKQGIFMYQLENHPLSDFIVFDLDGKTKRIHSFPTGINSLFVDTNSLSLFQKSKKNNELYHGIKKLLKRKKD